MKIGIRADGGSIIGMGHIMRTLVVAKELSKRHEVFYICRIDKDYSDKYSIGIEKIKSEGFDVCLIDEKRLKNDIKNIKADCIITDSYDVDEEYFDILRQSFKINGCFDDENICDYFNVNFLINQNTYANELKYKAAEDCLFMLGSEFVILRDDFRNTPKKEIKKNIQRVMITVGSTDNNNITEKILNKLKVFDFIIDAVIGKGFKYKSRLEKFETSNNINLHFDADMCKLMKSADIAIASCGTTIYELAACGTPAIGLSVVGNQNMAAADMDEKGLIIQSSSIDDIPVVVKEFDYLKRKTMSEKQQRLVDGRGYKKIADNINMMLTKLKLDNI